MATFYQMEKEDSEIGCSLNCKLNSKCKQAGSPPTKDGRSICYILGEETDVSIYVDNFTLLKGTKSLSDFIFKTSTY